MTISANYPTVAPSLNLDFANSQQLDPRITFSRPTTAAYYDADTTALAEQNLLLQSQALATTPWALYAASISGTLVTAPDGTTTAQKIIESSATGTHGEYQSITLVSGNTYTWSVYAKAGERTWLEMYAQSSAQNPTYFDLTNGVVGNTTAGNTNTITAVGNGWYRCSITRVAGSTAGFMNNVVAQSNGVENYTGDGTSGIYLWGAQLEQRSAVTAYNATTTTAITNYIPVLLTAPTNQARFDHDPVARTSLGLLIEQQSTNLLTWSADYTNAAWTKYQGAITGNAAIAPDGNQNAQLFVPTASTSQHFFGQSLGTSTQTFSIYVKSINSVYQNLTIWLASDNKGCYFNLSAQTVASVGNGGTGTITAVGNGWYRCAFTNFTPSTTQSLWVTPTNSTQVGLPYNSTGDGFSGMLFWGAQLEATAFPTSYIPTVASQVTRSADNASMTGTNLTSWYQQGSAGTFYLAGDYVQQTGNVGAMFGISDGTQNNRFNMTLFGSGISVNNYMQVAGGATGNINNNIGTPTSFKGAISVKQGTMNASQNGVVGTTAISILPTVLNRLDIGSVSYASVWANSHISKFAYYPAYCTQTQLQALTGS